MKGNSCVYVPRKGVKTFLSLKKEFGNNLAWKIYGTALNERFKEDYKESLSLDAEGIPSFDSLINNSYIQSLVGQGMKDTLSKKFSKRPDNIENYKLTIEEARDFNKSDSQFVAVVARTDEGELTVELLQRNEESVKKFSEQYAVYKLNSSLGRILSPVGVDIGMLSEAEVRAGRIGVTSFQAARNIATDSVTMIRIANNMEGAEALSEEFAHVMVRAKRNNPLVERNIRLLANEETLRAIFKDKYDDYNEWFNGDIELMAEEALGHILQSALLSQAGDDLQGRLVKNIQHSFKNIKEKEIAEALNEAEASMSNMAENILNGTITLTKKEIADAASDIEFNALSDRIERNIKMLKDALGTESKRLKIVSGNDEFRSHIKDVITVLSRDISNKKDTTLGVLTYANEALNALNIASKQLANFNTKPSNEKFKTLRAVKSTIQSYGGFINSLNEAAIEEEGEETNDFLREITVTNTKGNIKIINVKDTLNELNDMYNRLSRMYLKVSVPAFAEFLRPVLGDEITIEMGENKGKKITIEELLKQSESDISFTDLWLDAMGNSSDILLRAFDKVYKQAVDRARLKSIKDFKKIQALRQEAEKKGITSFEWMFERDRNGNKTGNYISPVNTTQFYKDKEAMEKRLDLKYGKNPKGSKLDAKMAERESWFNAHSKLNIFGNIVPNDTYENKEYNRLSTAQKDILNKFLELKQEFDNNYPATHVSMYKAVQMRKDGIQRFIDASKSPLSIWENIKNHMADEFLEREDDVNEGMGGRTSLTDFAGKEFMTLPMLYTYRLNNPNELTTDVFGSLMAYASASNNYHEIEGIIDPLETGRTIVHEYRKTKGTRGGLKVSERFTALGRTFQNDVTEGDGSNITKRLDVFFESQLYHRYFKDSGVLNVLGKKANKNKIVSFIMKNSAIAQLGFNWLTNMANVLTGVAMQNVEAAAGQYFNPKELLKADGIYTKYITSNLTEAASRNKTNRLSLFNELFNIRQDFERVSSNSLRKSVLARIFNSDIAYLGQSAGDHWLYMRTAIAMALREQVTVPGKGKMSLWDALQIVDTEGDTKMMKLPEGTLDSNGNLFDIGTFSRKIAHINQYLFGIYNTDDRNAAQRVIAGRLMLQFRNWMKIQFNRRFQGNQLNLDTNDYEEGYYRTVARITLGLMRGEYQLASLWSDLNDTDKFNVRRAVTELAQLAAVWMLANLIEWPDDKDRPWAIKYAEYASKRLLHELGTLVPSTIMLGEALKTVKSPAASLTYIQNVIRLFNSVIDPRDWTDDTKSGPYKGMSTLEKNIIRSGLPPFAQYRQLNKLIWDIDNATNWYGRNAQ